jgi:multimeric flavodoxin WrbA
MKNDKGRLKVLAINGSPRKNGNTATLLKEIGKIAKNRGDKVEQINLIDLDFSDCRECMGCKKGTECVTDDDMQGIYKKMQEADVILLGSPIFMDAETGLTKNMIDRTFALLAPREDGTFETRLRKGKKAFVVFTCGMNDGEIIYHKLTTRYFDTFVTMLGCKDFRSFIVPGASTEVNVLGRPATKTVLEEASRFFGAE